MLAEISVFFGEETGVVHQKARREVVGPVQHDVVLGDERENVLAVDILVIRLDRNLRVDGGQGFPAGLHFRPSERRGGVEDLALEVREIDDIPIDQADGADTGGSEIQTGR